MIIDYLKHAFKGVASDTSSFGAFCSVTAATGGIYGTDANMPPYLSIHFIIKAST